MKQIITFISILLLTACGHNIPTATLTFTKIEKNPAYDNSYFLYFSSDIELLNNLSEKHVGARLTCFFNEGKITESNYKNYNGYVLKSVKKIEFISKNLTYDYKTQVFFEDNNSDTSTRQKELKTISETLALLNTKPACLNCVVTAASYLDIPRRYISNTMCLPKEALKKVID